MICTLARIGPVYTSGQHAIIGSTDRFRSTLTREQTAIEPGERALINLTAVWTSTADYCHLAGNGRKNNLLHVCRACATRNLDAWNRFYLLWFVAFAREPEIRALWISRFQCATGNTIHWNTFEMYYGRENVKKPFFFSSSSGNLEC